MNESKSKLHLTRSIKPNLGAPAYTRVSPTWCCWYRKPDNSLLQRALLCIVGCLTASLNSRSTPTHLWQSQMSPDIEAWDLRTTLASLPSQRELPLVNCSLSGSCVLVLPPQRTKNFLGAGPCPLPSPAAPYPGLNVTHGIGIWIHQWKEVESQGHHSY